MPSAPWSCGASLAEHLPQCHFWFWSSCMSLKSPQMPLEVPSGLPDIFNQSPIISIIRICRIILKNFLSLNGSALHFRQNSDEQNEPETADPYLPKPLESPWRVSTPRCGGTGCRQLWTGETALPVTISIQNNSQAALQISSHFSLWHLRFMPNYSRTIHSFIDLGLFPIMASMAMKKKNEIKIIISRCSIAQLPKDNFNLKIWIVILKPTYPNAIGLILDCKNSQYLQFYLRDFLATFYTETKSDSYYVAFNRNNLKIHELLSS